MAADVTPETTVVVVDDQISTTVEDEEVVLQLESGVYYGLDGVGVEIWGLVQEPTTVAAIVDELVASHDVPREQCLADTVAFISDLAEEDLVELR